MKRLKNKILSMEPNTTTYKAMYEGSMIIEDPAHPTMEPYVENGYAYISEEMPLTLIPYGCTALRISCFPRADLRKKEK